CQHYYNTPLSF
nr:immunoglobulin light chain junction region [Macaca mulatta]